MRFKAGIAALALVAAVPAASAEPSGRTWSGLYVGGHAGYGRVPLQDSLLDPDGLTGGGQVGVNVQWGRVVAGIEGDYSAGSVDDTYTESIPGTFLTPAFNIDTTIDVESIASVRGRLGFTAYDNLLLFGTVGYAWAETEATVSVPAFDVKLTDKSDFEGLVYGAGFAYRFSELLSGRVEGLRYDLEQEGNDGEMTINVARIGLDLHLPVGR